MDYTLLGNDDRYRMLQARLRQYETRHFDATTNLQMAQATDDPHAPDLRKQIADFETCIDLVNADLAKLTPPDSSASDAPLTPRQRRQPGVEKRLGTK